MIKKTINSTSISYVFATRTPLGGHFPHYRRTSPAFVSKCRRAIHRFDRANSVTSCAVFFGQAAKAHLGVTELALDYPERMLDLGAHLSLGLFNLALGFVQHAALIEFFL